MREFLDPLNEEEDTLVSVEHGDANMAEDSTILTTETESDVDGPEQIVGAETKKCLLELLRYGLIERAAKSHVYDRALFDQDEIRYVLSAMDFGLKFDEPRGLAFLTILDQSGDFEEWQHPLVRRNSFTLEQSLVVALLRKYFLRFELDPTADERRCIAYLDQLNKELLSYLPALGSDSKELKRTRNILERLKPHGLVSEVDENDVFYIRPIIVHLANPENLQLLIEQYEKEAKEESGAEGDGDE